VAAAERRVPQAIDQSFCYNQMVKKAKATKNNVEKITGIVSDKKGVYSIEEQDRSERSEELVAFQKIIEELLNRIDELQKKTGVDSSRPLKIYNATIYDLDNPDYDLAIPVQIVIEEYSDETVARIPELNIFTSSDTDTEAILLLKNEIIDLYKELSECDNPGPLPQSWLNTLKKLLIKRN
jgi:hypothetical protein